MDEMLNQIENAIAAEYEEICRQGKIIAGIENVYRQIKFEAPELAMHVKKRMYAIAIKKDDLP